jgi:hypothetical protein
MAILVSEASNRYTHFFLIEREYFSSKHLRVILLNNYEISGIYEYHVWRYSCAKQLKSEKGWIP